MSNAPGLFDPTQHRSFAGLFYGPSKAGKSWLGYTTPSPRLILDTEAGRSSRFIPAGVRRFYWDPWQYGPPERSDAWDSCVVIIRTVADLEQVLTHLVAGAHPFRSVVLDSLWELQQQQVTETAGVNQMKVQDWGEVLRRMLSVINRMRDLCVAPVNPISVFMVTTAEKDTGSATVPFLQGQLKDLIAYKFDVVGYLFRYLHPETQESQRLVLVSDDVNYQRAVGLPQKTVAGEAVGGALGQVAHPNVAHMLDLIYGGTHAVPTLETTAAPAAPTAADAPQN